MNNKLTEKNKEHLPAKPPEILQKIKWLHIYGGKYKKYIIVAAVIVVGYLLFINFLNTDREAKKDANSNSEAQQQHEKKSTPEKSPDDNKPKTLYELFDLDCRKTSLFSEFQLKLKENNFKPYTIRYIICTDFKAKVFYLYFYLPKSNIIFDACKWLATGYKNILNRKLEMLLEGMSHRAPGESEELYSELKFSGRVFIYHETIIQPSNIEILTKLFVQEGLSPQFRGRDYLIMKNSPLYDNRY